MKKVLSWNNCQGRRASLEAEDGCIKWLVSFTIPLAFSGLSYFAVKEGVLYSPPGQANPTKVALDPFPIEYQRYRSSQACPPLACLLSGSYFAPCLRFLLRIPKGWHPAWSLVEGVILALPIQMPQGRPLGTFMVKTGHLERRYSERFRTQALSIFIVLSLL